MCMIKAEMAKKKSFYFRLEKASRSSFQAVRGNTTICSNKTSGSQFDAPKIPKTHTHITRICNEKSRINKRFKNGRNPT